MKYFVSKGNKTLLVSEKAVLEFVHNSTNSGSNNAATANAMEMFRKLNNGEAFYNSDKSIKVWAEK